MSICYVTAFLDLNRDKLKKFSRSFSTYLLHFLPLVRLMKKENESLVIFIDEKHFNIIQRYCQDNPKIILIKINRNYLRENSIVWRMLDREKIIMNSQEFKNLIGGRILYPEHNNPEYTMINHAKIDFVNLAIQNTKSQFPYYAWIDFGYFQKIDNIPNSLLDINKLHPTRITYTLINKLNELDENVLYTLLVAPERIGGFFFFGKKETLIEYQKLYHDMLKMFQDSGIADDDQHVALRCYYKNPDMFDLVYLGGWHKALTQFQK